MISCGLILFIGLGFFFLKRGEWTGILDYIAGKRIVVKDQIQNMGSIPAGVVKPLSFHVSNLTDKSVRVVGARATCGCIEVKNLPREILQSDTEEIEVLVETPASPGPISGKVILLTDSPLHPTAVLQYSGIVE